MILRLAEPRYAPGLALAAVLGIVVATIATVVGHVGLAPGFDPVALTVSDLALSDHGTAITVAMVALGLASLALLALLAGLVAARAPVRGWPAALLLGWSLGLLVSAAVPTDQIGAPPISVSGYVHRYASVGAFLCLPAGAWGLAARLDADARWRRVPMRIRAAVIASGVCLLAMFYTAFPGDRMLLGLVERILIAVEVALVSLLALRLYQITLPSAPKAPMVHDSGRLLFGDLASTHSLRGRH